MRDLAQKLKPGVCQTAVAAEALQEATEAYMVGLFKNADLLAEHAKRVTIGPKDMQLVLRLRGDRL